VAARLYLQRIEHVTGVPIHLVSTSPDREHTILMRHPFWPIEKPDRPLAGVTPAQPAINRGVTGMLTEDGKHLYVSYDEYHDLIEKLAIKVHQSGWRSTPSCAWRAAACARATSSRIFDVPLAIMSTSSYRAEEGTVQGHLDIAHYITTPRARSPARCCWSTTWPTPA
jgi:hypothetical protein